ncbi:MAG: hypothetical protein H6736_16150 [Alphaproteobacteria bacterium]|nr:hypothetical protein [Alphaproteobacteria bacterium]
MSLFSLFSAAPETVTTLSVDPTWTVVEVEVQGRGWLTATVDAPDGGAEVLQAGVPVGVAGRETRVHVEPGRYAVGGWVDYGRADLVVTFVGEGTVRVVPALVL